MGDPEWVGVRRRDERAAARWQAVSRPLPIQSRSFTEYNRRYLAILIPASKAVHDVLAGILRLLFRLKVNGISYACFCVTYV